MARRRELKSIASGIAAHCVSRNNDIFGYWALGIVYNITIQRGVDFVSLDIASDEALPRELSAIPMIPDSSTNQRGANQAQMTKPLPL